MMAWCFTDLRSRDIIDAVANDINFVSTDEQLEDLHQTLLQADL